MGFFFKKKKVTCFEILSTRSAITSSIHTVSTFTAELAEFSVFSGVTGGRIWRGKKTPKKNTCTSRVSDGSSTADANSADRKTSLPTKQQKSPFTNKKKTLLCSFFFFIGYKRLNLNKVHSCLNENQEERGPAGNYLVA